MGEREISENEWAVKRAEAIIKAHAELQRVRSGVSSFPKNRPFVTGVLTGSFATLAALLIIETFKPKARK